MSDNTTQSQTRSSTAVPTRVSELLPVVFRAVAAVLLLPSAVLKALDYGGQVTFFADIGVPVPALAVAVVALLELVAGILVLTGVYGRTGALTAVPIMVTAIALVGPEVTNVAVLVACLGILGLGTGRYSLGGEQDVLQRVG